MDEEVAKIDEVKIVYANNGCKIDVWIENSLESFVFANNDEVLAFLETNLD